MLPVHVETPRGRARLFSTPSMREYFRRVVHFAQMDMDYTFAQMLYLCCQPSKVYQLTAYRKQTKNQWARDDPAFVVALVFFLLIAACAHALAFQVSGVDVLRIIGQFIVVHFFFTGVLIATLSWFVCSNYLRVYSVHGVEQAVEWLYAFDVHCNAFFPLFLVLYVLHYFLLPILLQTTWVATVLSSALYLVAWTTYAYITSLGYATLPFLEKTEVFLYPVSILAVVVLLCVILDLNLSRWSMYLLGL